LEARAIVVCDRFVDSTTAYQGGGRGVSVEILQQLSVIATAGLRPDLTLVIDVPADVGLVRSAKHKRMPRMPEQQMQFETDRMERELISFHERVRAEFLRLAREEPDRVKVVDGTKSIAEVAAEVRRFVDALIGEP
jgi:dTMP kinase